LEYLDSIMKIFFGYFNPILLGGGRK